MLTINGTPIYVGTSGYKYDDWAKSFYPFGMSNEDFLDFYLSQGLNFIELTFTFYNIPTVEDIERMVEGSKGRSAFVIRMHKEFMKGKFEKADEFLEGIKPMTDAGLVKGFLADFKPDLKASTANMDAMERLRDRFSCAPLYTELYHRSWYKDKYMEDLRARELGVCVTDKYGLPYKPVMSPGPTAYFRLFGKTDGLGHNYSLKEMKSVFSDVKNFSVVSKEIFVSFCNVASGTAPKNARQFTSLVSKAGG